MNGFRRYLLRSAAVVGLALGPALTGQADTGWKQVGFFRADTRNLAVGDTVVRVVSLPDRNKLGLTGDFVTNPEVAERHYPGWDYKTDLVVFYRPTASGYVQSSFEYGIGLEQQPLPGDSIPTHLGVFDHEGKRTVSIPASLRRMLGSNAWIVEAMSADWDEDGQKEWVVAVSSAWSEEKGAPITLTLLDPTDSGWFIEGSFRVDESARSGPLEIRDVTGDGSPDIVYRYFHESMGHFWVDARIYSRAAGMPARVLPMRFDPTASEGPTHSGD